MAVDVLVRRGAGDQQGDDIVDGLLATVPAALARGRNELDERATLKIPASYETVFRTGVRLGDFVELQDLLERRSLRGKVTSVVHNITPKRVQTKLVVERVSEFG